MSNLKLGKLPVRHDARTLKLEHYMGQLAPPPQEVNWQAKNPNLKFNMFLNDRLGDCTCASIGHAIQRWTFDATQNEVSLQDNDILTAYEAVSGYNPQTGANDNGAVELDVLNYWRQTGVGGHKISAYAKINVQNHTQIKQAINLFGMIYIGIQVPQSAMDQFNANEPWSVVDGSPIEGGHAITVGGYNDSGLHVVTWARRQKMNWGFWNHYADEAYAVLSPDWFSGDKDPQGLDLASLQNDLQVIENS